jgi:hypothetical protein
MARQLKLSLVTQLVRAMVLSTFTTAPAQALAEDAESREGRLARAEAILAEEPTWAETRRQAVRYLEVDPESVERVRRGVRAKAGVPALRVSSRVNRTQASHELDDSGPNAALLDSTEEYGGTWSRSFALLSWNLPDGVFNPAELQLYQQSGSDVYVSAVISRLYFIRRQLLLALLVDPPMSGRAYDAQRIRVEGFTSLLNRYTGGWFGRQLPEGSF